MQALPNVPWGAQSNVLAEEDVAALIEAGADFVSLTGLTSSLEALRDEDTREAACRASGPEGRVCALAGGHAG